jgi:beta-phosphoglucomutase-like phosphatase (HAD superfamily)
MLISRRDVRVRVCEGWVPQQAIEAARRLEAERMGLSWGWPRKAAARMKATKEKGCKAKELSQAAEKSSVSLTSREAMIQVAASMGLVEGWRLETTRSSTATLTPREAMTRVAASVGLHLVFAPVV